ncbi:uncharacterized protein LOC108744318 [Agrilus planipennis]|uniref:Uncharacterized protein LOC108744318 n=1 Tax=Agrilus planipennis TaxID=224129 RepID=A0A7F5R7W4_AGRPL|nr:uncharacterized protein LOC108744318 [Agrilus planipennis]
MSRCLEAPPNSGSINDNFSATIPTTWSSQSTTTNTSNTLLLIAVEYVKDNEYKFHTTDTAFAGHTIDSSPIFEQQVSPLDPNMSSAAQYSPESPSYPDESNSLSNSTVVEQLISRSQQPVENRCGVNSFVCSDGQNPGSVLADSGHLLKDVTTDQLLLNQNGVAGAIGDDGLALVSDPEQEVELLITDQATGISYSVSAQEYLVERSLADDQQLLDVLAPDPLLDTDFLALDESTLKCELKDIDVSSGNILGTEDGVLDGSDVNLGLGDTDNLEATLVTKLDSTNEKDVLLRRSQRQNETNSIENEESLLSRVHTISDKPVPTRARASLPASYLVINKKANDEYGVFARKVIPKRTQFGPLEGKLKPTEKVKKEDSLCLLLEMEEGKIMQLDVSDENIANWMCFVRKANNSNEQNLVVSQQGSSLYYTTTKCIFPKQELLVGYSRSYATKHGFPTLQSSLEDAKEWPCFECGESFRTWNELNIHDEVHDINLRQPKKPHKPKVKVKRTQRPRILECKACRATFPNFKFNIFLTHLRQHGIDERESTEDKKIKVSVCDICELLFPSTDVLAIHQLDHKKDFATELVPLECPYCFENFSQLSQLISHVNTHTVGMIVQQAQMKGYRCPICYKIFASRERIQRHMLVHGSEESKPLKCDTCGKRFLNNSALACHVKTHGDGRCMFECPICKEQFRHVLQLKLHVPKHKEDGKYPCPHCDKIFKEYCIIRKHIRAFHCERKHGCPHCSKLFPTLDKLKMHLLRHSDHREFLCADCGKQFKRKDKLNEHTRRMHTEERENAVPRLPKMVHQSKKFTPKVQPTDYHRFIYKCHSCLVGFKRRGMLVNHLAKRHPDISPDSVPELNLPILRTTRDYYCQYCDKVYKSSSKRKAHILKNHPGQELPLSNRKVGNFPEIPGLPNPTFSQTVGSVTTRPQACQWCHKQYASKAKLLQHQRKKHPECVVDGSNNGVERNGNNGDKLTSTHRGTGVVQRDEVLGIVIDDRACFKRDLEATNDDLFTEVVTLGGDKGDNQFYHVITVPNTNTSANMNNNNNNNNNDPNNYYSRIYRSLASTESRLVISVKLFLTKMWGLFGTLFLLVTGMFSVEGEILSIRHGIPPAREPEIRTSPEWGTITQRVDHFNPADNRTWEMRYIQNNAFFEEGGPIFVFIGGEWAISTGWVRSGIFFNLAQLHNATLFYTEHRFYGNSFPMDDLTTDSLKYLSADQALADLMYFIEYQKQNTPGLQNSTVVVAGSSYAGTLATWARIKYPHIVDIAYSSSGPLHAKADFTEYFEVVEETLRLASPTCPALIRRAMSEIVELLETPEGSANVSELFRTCAFVNGSVEPDRSYFLSTVASPFATAVQYAVPGDLNAVCAYLEAEEGSDIEKLAAYVAPTSGCTASYDYFVEYYSATQIGSGVTRQWLYQTCTEYGWYQTQAFGDTFTVDLYYQICNDIYGEVFGSSTLSTGIQRTNLFYGSIEPEVTRLITCHGTGDPWHKMGLLNDLSENVVTIVVNGTSHSADLYSIRASDSEEMVQAKNRIMDTISAWIYEIEGDGESTTEIPITITTIPPTTPITGDDDNNNDTDNFAISNHPTMISFLGVLFIVLTM